MSSTPIRHSYQQFKDSVNQFIFFSPLTLGETGRAVKINKALFLPFFCAVDPATYDGQTIVRQIENLRNTTSLALDTSNQRFADPKHKAQMGKISNATQRTLVVKNLHVHYRVTQEQSDRAPYIYITGIRAVGEADKKQPGLYDIAMHVSTLKGQKRTEAKLQEKNVYINGGQSDFDDAMNKAKQTIDTKNVTLFYNPSDTSNDLGLWGSAARTHTTTATIEELAKVFKNNTDRAVTWHVEGEGAALVTETLTQIGSDLSNHEFRFINPIANTVKLLEAVNKRKANLTDKSFTYENNNSSLLPLFADKDRIKTALGKMVDGKHKNVSAIKAGLITKHLETAIPMSSPTQISTLNAAGQTFVQVLQKAGIYRQ